MQSHLYRGRHPQPAVGAIALQATAGRRAGGASELAPGLLRLPWRPIPAAPRPTSFRPSGQPASIACPLGVQSFDDLSLERLGRIHDGAEARDAVCCRSAGWHRESQYRPDARPAGPGPGRAPAPTSSRRWRWRRSTCPGTSSPSSGIPRSGSQPPTLPGGSLNWAEIQSERARRCCTRPATKTTRCLPTARKEQQCRHNLNYWELWRLPGHWRRRSQQAHPPRSDSARGQATPAHRVPPGTGTGVSSPGSGPWKPRILAGDFMMNALRLTAGVEHTLFTERTGLPADALCVNPSRTAVP